MTVSSKLALLIAIFSVPPLPAQEFLLERFPLELRAGAANPAEPELLPDLPFDPARGYGYVGGEASRRAKVQIAGGQPGWPAAWRENPRKYSFHVPNRGYLVKLSFVETDAAAAGLRVFDIYAEDREYFTGLDIFKEAGDFHWLTIEGLVNVQDGWLDLRFVPSGQGRPPRISRLHIAPAEGLPAALPAPALEAGGEFRRNRLLWKPLELPGVAGYGIYRAASPEGPYESLSDQPVLVPRFFDRGLPPSQSFFYRLRAFGVEGNQSPLSASASAETLTQLPGNLRVFELSIPAAELPRLGDRAAPPREVPGELLFYGGRHPVRVSAFTGIGEWQARKSYRVKLEGGKRFFGHGELLFFAEPGDPTFLREKIFCEAQNRLGLAAPQASYVHLILNGDYLGIYLDRESLESGFRARAKLDRVGDFARIDPQALRRLEWKPYGEELEGNNSLWNLTLFVQELQRLNEGEMEAYFAERLYLDRFLRRLAALAVCGRQIDPSAAHQVYLGDSRNGKWEVFVERAPEGAFGIASFQDLPGPDAAAQNLAPEAAHRALYGHGLQGKLLPAAGWRILETRFFNAPARWRSYLDEIEKVYNDLLTPEAMVKLVEEAAAPAAQVAAIGDAAGAPALLARFEAHRQALLPLLEEERLRSASAVAVSEFLLNAPVGEAWIEIENRSKEAADLGPYRLSNDLDRPDLWSFPSVSLAAGERQVVSLGGGAGPLCADISFSPRGGVILLARAAGRGRFEIADLAFYGHQTPGFSYGRRGVGWGFFARPTPGTGNAAISVDPPTWRYRQGIAVEKNGDYTVWLAPIAVPGSASIKEVSLLARFPGQTEFQKIPMKWDDKAFRYEVTVARLEGDPRAPYYFQAVSESGLERPYPLAGADLPLSIPSRPKLFLNEILPRPDRENPLGEFVEIYNAGDEPVSLEGMFLTDNRRNPAKWRIPRTEPVPPKGFAVLYADGRGMGDHAPFRLSNSGEYLGLYHRLEEGNILIDQMAYNAIPMDKSYGRSRDGEKGFQVWKDPTPGKRNLPKIPEEYLRGKKAEEKPGDGQAPQPTSQPEPR